MKGVAHAVERDERLTLPIPEPSHLDYTLYSPFFTTVTNKHASAFGEKYWVYPVRISVLSFGLPLDQNLRIVTATAS
jgi:hypothetical protein